MSNNRDLAPNMTRDLKAHRHPQAIVKLNAAPDMNEYNRRKEFGKEALYLMSPLEGEMADAKFMLAEGDIAYTMVTDAPRYPAPKSSERNFMNQDFAMKVNTAVNGLQGKDGNTDAMDDIIEPCGFIEMGNDETRTAKVNLLRGGAFTVLYNGAKPSRENAWLRARVPTSAEAAVMQSDKASHARGVDGVVTLMLEEYNPLKTTYLSVEKLARILEDNKNPDKSVYTARSRKAASAMVDTYVNIANHFGARITRSQVIAAIENAAKSPAKNVQFISAHNEFVQLTADARRNVERSLCCKTQHATSNGIYTSVEVGRYGY